MVPNQYSLIHGQLRELEIKYVELIMLNFKYKKGINNKLSSVLCRSCQLFMFNILPNLVCISIRNNLSLLVQVHRA